MLLQVYLKSTTMASSSQRNRQSHMQSQQTRDSGPWWLFTQAQISMELVSTPLYGNSETVSFQSVMFEILVRSTSHQGTNHSAQFRTDAKLHL